MANKSYRALNQKITFVDDDITTMSTETHDQAFKIQWKDVKLTLNESPTINSPIINSPTLSDVTINGGTAVNVALTNPSMTDAFVQDGSLSSVVVNQSNIQVCNISGSTITGGTITTSTLNNCDLNGGTLSETAIQEATLLDPIINGGTMSNVTFDSELLTGCVIENSTIKSPNINDGSMLRTTIRDSELDNCTFLNVTWENQTIINSTLDSCELTSAQLSIPTLINPNISGGIQNVANITGNVALGGNINASGRLRFTDGSFASRLVMETDSQHRGTINFPQNPATRLLYTGSITILTSGDTVGLPFEDLADWSVWGDISGDFADTTIYPKTSGFYYVNFGVTLLGGFTIIGRLNLGINGQEAVTNHFVEMRPDGASFLNSTLTLGGCIVQITDTSQIMSPTLVITSVEGDNDVYASKYYVYYYKIG